MKNSKIIPILVTFLSVFILISSFTNYNTDNNESEILNMAVEKQTINMFVTHGHCSTPFTGNISNLNLDLVPRKDLGNPLEDMKLSFEINPLTFNICNIKDDEINKKIKEQGLFHSEQNKKITFRTTNTFTMGIDWYQINGILSIKGVEKQVKFFATGIRNSNNTWPTALVLEGQINLIDWGIDYDKAVHGQTNLINTKWMHFNMKMDIKK